MSKENLCREKQIEEMAKDVWKASCAGHGIECTKCEYANNSTDKYSCVDFVISKNLYNAGYRKQSENMVELPCKIGDTVYRVKKRRGIWYILPREVVSLTYRLDYLHRPVWEIFTTATDVLGKGVFLTEEEAENALAKMKGGKE